MDQPVKIVQPLLTHVIQSCLSGVSSDKSFEPPENSASANIKRSRVGRKMNSSSITLISVGIFLVLVGVVLLVIKFRPSDSAASPPIFQGPGRFMVSGPVGLVVIVIGVFCITFSAISYKVTGNNGSVNPTPTFPSPTPTQPAGITASPSPTPDALPSAPTIKIIIPSSGSYVNLNNDVKVQLSGVDMSRQVWLLVQLGSQVFPQGPCDTVSLTVTDCPAVRFGAPGMLYGTRYKVTAVLVNLQDNNKYMPYYENGFSAQSPPVSPIRSSSSITVYGRE